MPAAARSATELIEWATQTACESGKGLEAVSLMDSLAGLTPEQAAWRPAEGVASTWEIVNHLLHWKGVVLKLLDGQSVSTQGDWPSVKVVTEPAWEAARSDLKTQHEQIRQHLRSSDDEGLSQAPPVDEHWPWSHALLGLVAHDCYHTGQIMMLRQLQGI